MTSELDDPDKLRRAAHWFGGDPRVRRAVEVEVLREGANEWSLPEFAALIDGAVAKIPKQDRAKAIVALDGGYEESTRLIISYERPETDDEVRARVDRALVYLRNEDRKERSAYEALKRKFEP